MGSIPRLDELRGSRLNPIQGIPPDLIDTPTGCPFQPRCPYAVEDSIHENPALREVAPGHQVGLLGRRPDRPRPTRPARCPSAPWGSKDRPKAHRPLRHQPWEHPHDRHRDSRARRHPGSAALDRRHPPGRAPEDVLPDQPGRPAAAASAGSGPSTTSPSTSGAARRWASSASPAAARAPPGRAILQLYKPTAGAVRFEGRDLTKLSARRHARRCAATSRWSSRTRTPA